MERLDSGDPRWIGGYRLLGRLGEGGMGRVYLARSGRGRTVAVKAVRTELAKQPDFRRRFAQEITAARRVGMGSAPGEAHGESWTAPVLDADTTAAEPWVATGYIAGPSLAQVVDEDYGPLPEQSVRALATGLIKALQAIHAAGLIHRDLKPSNILLTFDGPRVIDFGIARAVDAALQSSGGLTGTGAVIGSPGFMSPEQVRGVTVTPASDVFCLGTVLAYAATGRMPFGGADSGVHALMFRIAQEDPDLSGLSGPLHELVAACLAKAPEARPTLAALAARTQGEISGTWLPGEVLAQLGRHAVQLLDSEDPDAVAAALGAAGPVPSTPPPPVSPASSPSSTPPPTYGGPYGYPQQPWQQGGGPHGPGQPHTGYQPASPYGPGVAAGPRPAPSPARSARSLATPTWILLAVMMGWLVVDLIFSGVAFNSLDDSPQVASPASDADFASLKSTAQALNLLGGLLLLATATMWALWFWRLRQNAEAFAPGRLRYAPGMAIGAWFIPVVNLFMPKQIANDIWSASAPGSADAAWYGHRPPAVRRGLLNGWWTMVLVYVSLDALFSMDNWFDSSTVSDAQEWLSVGMFGDLLGIPATALALAVVLRLTRLQENRITGRA